MLHYLKTWLKLLCAAIICPLIGHKFGRGRKGVRTCARCEATEKYIIRKGKK